MDEAADTGTLYVVATPIGHLDDISARALQVLGSVALIAAEDTRHSRGLLAAFDITTPLSSLHEHNETQRIAAIETMLREGSDVALISDAGTPLIADPGFRLVRAVAAAGLPVRGVPGACAAILALSCAGLPSDRFAFEGFLPSRSGARRKRLDALATQTATLVFYEAPHRVSAMLEDLRDCFGADREAWVGRELTKRFEDHRRGSLAELAQALGSGAMAARGEFVVLVRGCDAESPAADVAVEALLDALLEELPASRAARVAARLSGLDRQACYQMALQRGPR